MMPAGTYYIGDLCYVMHDVWDEFCDLTITKDHVCVQDGEMTLHGKRFATYSTMYGDGVYHDKQGKEYGVDAGLIGCIHVDCISVEEHKNLDLGHVHKFDRPFRTGRSMDGTIYFGDVEIHTGDCAFDTDTDDYDPDSDD